MGRLFLVSMLAAACGDSREMADEPKSAPCDGDCTPPATTSDLRPAIAWFDASDSNGVTLADGRVLAWLDKTGNGHQAVGAPGRQPQRVVGADGLAVLRFGPAEWLEVADSPALTPKRLSLAAVFTLGSGPWATVAMKSADGSWTSGGYGLSRRGLESALVFWANNYALSGATDVLAPAAQRYVAIGIFDEASVSLWLNGVRRQTVPSAGSIADDPNPLRIGAGESGLGGAYPLSGDIAELILYEGALGEGQIQTVHAYLASKWGVP